MWLLKAPPLWSSTSSNNPTRTLPLVAAWPRFKFFLQKNLDFAFKILATEDGRWRVKSECGQEAEFDAVIVATAFFGAPACLKVVVTAPVPQILQLGGTVHERLQDQPQLLQKLEKVSFLRLSFFRYKSIHSILYICPLKKVEYSTRFVLGMFFNEPVDLGVDWSASYIGDHPILRFVSIDNLKRGLGDGSPTSVTQPSKSPW